MLSGNAVGIIFYTKFLDRYNQSYPFLVKALKSLKTSHDYTGCLVRPNKFNMTHKRMIRCWVSKLGNSLPWPLVKAARFLVITNILRTFRSLLPGYYPTTCEFNPLIFSSRFLLGISTQTCQTKPQHTLLHPRTNLRTEPANKSR
jgi:hypothetical protein